ncbi:MAG: hypothetical protein UZ21_OP11001000988 [Microgenomates bacterium OLB22]|nr:MAG: hypothetical protein UZ21_OP11001000988 [Microgenomates bacterium OLB22]
MALPFLGSGSITTGDATVTAKILNLLNTNIVGNNWYYVMVNVFGNWKGNIRFARPDLTVRSWWSKPRVRPGETVTLSILSGNQGLVWAERTKLNLQLPAGISLLSSDIVPQNSPGILQWFWDRFEKSDTRQINLVLKVADDVVANSLQLPIDISSGFREDETGNNNAIATLEIEQSSSDSYSSQVQSLNSPITQPISPTPSQKKLTPLFASAQAQEKSNGDMLSTSTTAPSAGFAIAASTFSHWWLLVGLIAVTVRRILQEE